MESDSNRKGKTQSPKLMKKVCFQKKKRGKEKHEKRSLLVSPNRVHESEADEIDPLDIIEIGSGGRKRGRFQGVFIGARDEDIGGALFGEFGGRGGLLGVEETRDVEAGSATGALGSQQSVFIGLLADASEQPTPGESAAGGQTGRRGDALRGPRSADKQRGSSVACE